MALPKDFVCKAFHYCWLDCHNCLVVKMASKEELEDAKISKAEYLKKIFK